MPRRLKNIRKWKSGWQAYVRVAGRLVQKSFPSSTPALVMRTWCDEQRRRYVRIGPAAGSFAADIQNYLTRVSAMPTFKQRTAHLALWAQALGRDRPRWSITTADLDHVMQGWLTAGAADATVRKRRTALLAFWHKLDGRGQPNPVRSSTAPREPKAEARSLDLATVQRILAVMPASRSQRRIAVLAWTGLPPSILSAVRREDIDWTRKTLHVQPRRKGAGTAARTLPLLTQAVTALRAFHRADDYGPFGPNWTVFAARSFKRAATRLQIAGVRLYDVRHAFLAHIYRTTHDLATVARFGLHASLQTSQRYAQSATQDIDRHVARRAGELMRSTTRRAESSRIVVPVYKIRSIN